jgi:hypothetical protein
VSRSTGEILSPVVTVDMVAQLVVSGHLALLERMVEGAACGSVFFSEESLGVALRELQESMDEPMTQV